MRSRETASVARRLAAVLGLGVVAGCGGLEPVAVYEPITEPTQLFKSLALNHRAATLSTVAPYDTLRLVATPLDALGEPIEGMPAPTFVSRDPLTADVTADGLVTARKVGTGVRVIVSLVIEGNVRQEDTLLVDVTSVTPPPVLASVSIDRADSSELAMLSARKTKRAMHGLFGLGAASVLEDTLPLTTQAVDVGGMPIPALRSEYWSLDSTVATVDRRTGRISRLRPGSVRFVGRTTAYGVTKVDTATFTVTGNVGVDIAVLRTGSGTVTVDQKEVTIVPYGHVFWTNTLNEPVEVTFDDPAAALGPLPGVCGLFNPFVYGPNPFCDGDGNLMIPPPFIGALGSVELSRGRRFLTPGVYTFHVRGVTGRVVVVDPSAP